MNLNKIKRLILKARDKQVAANAGVSAVYDALYAAQICLDACTAAPNADNLGEAINCFIQYGEFSIEELMLELSEASVLREQG